MNEDVHQNKELTTKETLDQAAKAIKDGEISLGKSKLELVLQREPNNVLAWLWMSRCFQDQENKLRCFRKVLAIDPNNKYALEGIRAIEQHEQETKEKVTHKSSEVIKEDSMPRTYPQGRGHSTMTNGRKDSAGWKWLFLGSVGTFFTIVIVGLLGFKLGLFQNKATGTNEPSSQSSGPSELSSQSSELSEPPSQNTGLSVSTMQEWEYQLDVLLFDSICGTQAGERYANVFEIGLEWLATCGGFNPEDEKDFYEFIPEYTKCGYDYFQSHTLSMGELGWEMVSYDHVQYTQGSQFCGSFIIDYGYEIMWKRPLSTK